MRPRFNSTRQAFKALADRKTSEVFLQTPDCFVASVVFDFQNEEFVIRVPHWNHHVNVIDLLVNSQPILVVSCEVA